MLFKQERSQGSCTRSGFHGAATTVQQAQLPAASPTPNYRVLLNQYCQNNAISYKAEFTEDHSKGKPQFKCTITCLFRRSKIVPSKKEAKEVAAHKILLEFEKRDYSWKSKLKEHYNKQGKAALELKYRTVELDDGSFTASIFIPELRREVGGERGRSKKEAEHNAAKTALKLLELQLHVSA